MKDHFLLDATPLVAQDASAAVIVVDDSRYLLQLRDQKAGLFYPGHWGLFGGAIEPHETPLSAMRRELAEELDLSECDPKPLSDFKFQFSAFGTISRFFFEVDISNAMLARLKLTEGSAMKTFPADEILIMSRVVPYDSFAIWLHANRARLG